MLMDIFHLHPETQVFDEARRLEGIPGLQDSRHRTPCGASSMTAITNFRVSRSSRTATSCPPSCDGLEDATVLWMYREPGPNAASRPGEVSGRDHGDPAPSATAARAADGLRKGCRKRLRRKLRSLDRSRFTDFDYACLVWWARNQLFFELNLVNDPRVRLLRYETLVSQPESTMQRAVRMDRHAVVQPVDAFRRMLARMRKPEPAETGSRGRVDVRQPVAAVRRRCTRGNGRRPRATCRRPARPRMRFRPRFRSRARPWSGSSVTLWVCGSMDLRDRP